MRKLAVFGLLALATAVSAGALAQASPPAPAFRPGLGDLMTMTVQPRDLKLGLAGQEKNWALAAYQLHELEESFESVAHAWPKCGVPRNTSRRHGERALGSINVSKHCGSPSGRSSPASETSRYPVGCGWRRLRWRPAWSLQGRRRNE